MFKRVRERIILSAAVIFVSLSLFSCDFDESNRHLYGGILLDDSIMSEIKNDILNGETLTLEPTELESLEGGTQSEALLVTEAEETVNWDEYEGDVYWTESGSVWHVTDECSSLKKSSDIISGSVAQAIEEGKKRVCSKCGK